MDHWIVTGLGILGFFLTWTGMVVSVTKAVSAIKSDTSEKLAEETTKITERIDGLAEQFEQEQKSQDNHFNDEQKSLESRFGEVGMSLRQYIANVEKEMHEIEIWGRDNFVLKSDFMKATDRLETVIRDMTKDIKADLREMSSKIDGHNNSGH